LRRDVSLWDELHLINLLVNFGKLSAKIGKRCAAAAWLVFVMTINIVLYHRDKIILGQLSDMAHALLNTDQ
jgi:hypothetical protein